MRKRSVSPWWLLAGAALSTACSHPLPEEGTPAARLYEERCGSCHRAYVPSTMKAAMWDMKFASMEDQAVRAGGRPLREDERRAILDYLRRNSG